jgi:hypothetical protein
MEHVAQPPSAVFRSQAEMHFDLTVEHSRGRLCHNASETNKMMS